MPNYLLQWEMICWALHTGCRVYDFRGVSGGYDESAPFHGLIRFKAGFGGELVELLDEHDLILHSHTYTLLRNLLSLHGKLCRKQTPPQLRRRKFLDTASTAQARKP